MEKPYKFTHIKLKSLTMYMTYINIQEDVEFRYYDGDSIKTYEVKKGYYNIENMIAMFKKVGCTLVVDKNTGSVKITGAEENNVEIPAAIIHLLGLTRDRTGTKTLQAKQTAESIQPPRLTPLSLHVYLDELDRDCNLYNGNPSNLLCIIPLTNAPKFGDVISIEPKSSFKRLAGYNINRFKFTIKDSAGYEITNLHFNIELELLL